MASVTKTFYDNNGYGNDSLWTVIFTGQDYTATSATITVNPYHISAKYDNSYPAGKGLGALSSRGYWSANSSNYIRVGRYDNSGSSITPIAWAVGAYYSENVISPNPATVTINTSSLFNSNNSTERSVNLNFVIPQYFMYAESNGSSIRGTYQNDTQWTLTLGKVTLDVPPTGTVSNISYDTVGYIYAGLTTASVDISNLTAYYGGTITDVTLTIGNQSVSRTDNGTLSILLNQGGTFTPTVVITDSRGQTKTTTFEQITVGTYNAPSLSFDAERTTSTGTPDDEGTYTTVDAILTFTDVVADAVAPTITVTDEDGVAQTVSTTWYSTRASDGTLSGSVTWANLSSGDTVYGFISITGGFNTQKSYEIALTPEDSQSTGTTITQTLATAFYTLDFLAGGHGIAFGKPAINTGFECAMDATFEDTLTAQDMTQQEVDDFVDNIGGGGSHIADKVVEQGTSDIWNYRKWSSGIAECWGTWGGTLTHYANPLSGYYGYYNTVSFPVGLFISPPNATYTAGVGNGFAWAGAYMGTTVSNMTCYAIANVSGSQSVRFSISVKGRWK